MTQLFRLEADIQKTWKRTRVGICTPALLAEVPMVAGSWTLPTSING